MNEGLETRGFAPEKEQWSNPITVEVVTVGAATDRRRMLQFTFQRGDKGKAAVERRVNWTVTDDSLLAFFIANRTGKPIGHHRRHGLPQTGTAVNSRRLRGRAQGIIDLGSSLSPLPGRTSEGLVKVPPEQI